MVYGECYISRVQLWLTHVYWWPTRYLIRSSEAKCSLHKRAGYIMYKRAVYIMYKWVVCFIYSTILVWGTSDIIRYVECKRLALVTGTDIALSHGSLVTVRDPWCHPTTFLLLVFAHEEVSGPIKLEHTILVYTSHKSRPGIYTLYWIFIDSDYLRRWWQGQWRESIGLCRGKMRYRVLTPYYCTSIDTVLTPYYCTSIDTVLTPYYCTSIMVTPCMMSDVPHIASELYHVWFWHKH
jgi:hypothetical protein